MVFISRRSTVPTSAALQDQLVTAQHEHARAVANANAELIAHHNSALSTVEDREQAIDEQVKLLTAEREALGKVRSIARNVKIAGQ